MWVQLQSTVSIAFCNLFFATPMDYFYQGQILVHLGLTGLKNKLLVASKYEVKYGKVLCTRARHT